MKKLILGLTLIAAALTTILNFGNTLNSEEGIAHIELSSLMAVAQADGESSGGSTNCYAGGVAPTSYFPTCQQYCPYQYMNNPQKTGTCNF